MTLVSELTSHLRLSLRRLLHFDLCLQLSQLTFDPFSDVPPSRLHSELFDSACTIDFNGIFGEPFLFTDIPRLLGRRIRGFHP